jgi:hypothetical protein
MRHVFVGRMPSRMSERSTSENVTVHPIKRGSEQQVIGRLSQASIPLCELG